MAKMRILTVVGTRPEIIRLSRVIPALDAAFDHILVHTGQNYDYELNGIFFQQLGLRKPDHFLGAAGKNAAETIANVIRSADRVLEKTRPEAFLVLGDTNSCMAALPAKRRWIPVFHMEAGNRCFDSRVPEEINRRLVDHLADINLPYSGIAREYLLAEGFPPDRIIKTGSPMYEVLHYYMDKIDASPSLEKLGLEPGNYFVVSCHREENVDYRIGSLLAVLAAVGKRYRRRIVMSVHPRTQARLQRHGGKLPKEVLALKPLGFLDYVRLQKSARAVLSDSGTISEESSILGFPALNIREAHERPEAMEEAVAPLVGLDPRRVLQGLEILDAAREESDPRRPVRDYDVSCVSRKVVRIILGYTDYVRRKVWSEAPSAS